MQYFTIVARKGGSNDRACAMLQAAQLDQAADKARRLINSEHLAFVDRNSRFSVRRSSRRETALLQSYLASCNGARLATYLSEDLDSLLWRRGSLLLSFFMMLYLAPKDLRRRFGPTPGDQTGGTGEGETPGGSSGGVTHEERDVTPGETIDEATAPEGETEAGMDGEGSPTDPLAPDEDTAPIDSSNHISALDDILNGSQTGSDRDADVDLGDLL